MDTKVDTKTCNFIQIFDMAKNLYFALNLLNPFSKHRVVEEGYYVIP